jgi:hypothetical protein
VDHAVSNLGHLGHVMRQSLISQFFKPSALFYQPVCCVSPTRLSGETEPCNGAHSTSAGELEIGFRKYYFQHGAVDVSVHAFALTTRFVLPCTC